MTPRAGLLAEVTKRRSSYSLLGFHQHFPYQNLLLLFKMGSRLTLVWYLTSLLSFSHGWITCPVPSSWTILGRGARYCKTAMEPGLCYSMTPVGVENPEPGLCSECWWSNSCSTYFPAVWGEQNWWLSNNPVLLFSPEKAELCGGISQKVWAMFGKPITRGTPQHCHLASRFLFLPLLIRISRCFSTECSGFRWAQQDKHGKVSWGWLASASRSIIHHLKGLIWVTKQKSHLILPILLGPP